MQGAIDLGDELNGQKGMTTEIEEIVANTDFARSQDALPNLRELGFQRCSRARRLLFIVAVQPIRQSAPKSGSILVGVL